MKLAAHLDSALVAGRRIDLPFPVFVFKPFPDDVYRAILANLPGDEFYQYLPHRDANRPDGTSTRLILVLKLARLAGLPEAQKLFWLDLAEELSRPDVREVFRYHLKLDGDLHPAPLLHRDLDGYTIKPHPDSKMKVCTIQAYLPPDDSDMRLGTTFYRQTKDLDFEPVFDVPFRPNLAYAFKVTDRSWHGTRFGSFSRPRDTMMMGYFREPFGMF